MKEVTVSSENIEALTQQLKVLANPKRLQIINLLMEGVQCNCELAGALDLPLNLISHHMAILRKAELVNVRRDTVDSRWIYFSINEPVLLALNKAMGAFFDVDRIQPRLPSCGPRDTSKSPLEVDFEREKRPSSVPK